MGCSCKGDAIVLANDSRIESEFNGDAAGYWDQSGNWMKPSGCTSLLLYLQILELQGPSGSEPTVTVLIEGSIDGKSWTYIQTVQDRAFRAVDVFMQRLVFPTRMQYFPLVRFGLQIGDGAASPVGGQVAARLSAVVTPLYGDNELVALSTGDSADGTADQAVEGTTIEVTGVSSLVGRVSSIGLGSMQTWVGSIQGSFDNETWFETGVDIDLVEGSAEEVLFSLGSDALPAWIRLYKSSGSTADQGLLSIEYLGRAF